jgi:hypothetical protein
LRADGSFGWLWFRLGDDTPVRPVPDERPLDSYHRRRGSLRHEFVVDVVTHVFREGSKSRSANRSKRMSVWTKLLSPPKMVSWTVYVANHVRLHDFSSRFACSTAINSINSRMSRSALASSINGVSSRAASSRAALRSACEAASSHVIAWT